MEEIASPVQQASTSSEVSEIFSKHNFSESNMSEILNDLQYSNGPKNSCSLILGAFADDENIPTSSTKSPIPAADRLMRKRKSASSSAKGDVKKTRGRPVSKLSFWDGQYFRIDTTLGCYVKYHLSATDDASKYQVTVLKKAPNCAPKKG